MSNEFNVAVKVSADASQLTAELKRAGQTLQEFATQAEGGSAGVTGALQGTTTAAQAMGAAVQGGAQAQVAGAQSAAQHADALRGAAAQITNTVTAMGGLAQQGTQAGASLGSTTGAVRALVSAAGVATTGLGALALAGGALIAAYAQGSAETDAYRLAIVSTGNAAGTTTSQLADYAREIKGVAGTQAKAAETLAIFTASGAVGTGMLREAAQSAIEWERATGQAASSTAAKFAALARDPLAATMKLNEGMNYLTTSTYNQIKALQEQGRTTDAAAAAQHALADALSSRAGEIESKLGTIERGWRGVKDMAASAWDAMLNIGRETTKSDRLAQLQGQLARLTARAPVAGQGLESYGAAMAVDQNAEQKRVDTLRAEIAALEVEIGTEQALAQVRAKGAADSKLQYEWDQQGRALRTRAQKRDAEILAAQTQGQQLLQDGLITEAQLRERIAAIQEKYKDRKGPAAPKGADSELASLQAQLQAAQRYGEQLTTMGTAASALNAGERASLKIGEELRQVTDGKTAARLREKQAIADTLGAQLRSNDGLQVFLKAHQAAIDANYTDAEAIEQRAKAQEAANATLGKSKTAIEQMTLAELQHQMAEAQASDRFDPKYIASLELKIAAQKRYVASLQGGDYKAAEQHVNELLRGAQELSKAYEDEQQLSGLTALEREKIAARRQVELKYAKELAAIDRSAYTEAEKQTLRDGVNTAKRQEIAAAEAKAQAQYMASASEEINRSLTDALMRGFESGKGMAQNLADTTKNLFNSMVLRPVLSAIVTPVSLVINGIVQQGLSAVGLGSSGSSALGLASNASSAYSLVNGGGALSGLSAGFMSGASEAAMGAAFVGPPASAAGGFIGAGGSLGSSGIGSALSAIPGWGWALAGGLALLTMFDFNSRGPHHAGGAYSTSGDALDQLGLSGDALGDFTTRGNAQVAGNVQKVVTGLSSVFDQLAGITGSGQQIDIAAGFAANSAYDDEDAYAYFKLLDQRTGEVLKDYVRRDDGLGKDVDKAWGQFVADMAGSLVQQIRGSDIPRWMDDALAGLGDSVTPEQLSAALASIQAASTAFTVLGRSLGGIAAAGDDSRAALVQAYGSLDAFTASTSNFYAKFVPAQQQYQDQLRAVQGVFDGLNLSVALSHQQFTELAGALDLSTEEGRKAFVALTGVADAFDALLPDLSAVTGTLGQTITSAMLGTFDGASAGAAMAANVQDGIYNAIAGNFASQITSIIVGGVVEPVITAAITGASVSAAVSQASIDAMVARAQAVADAYELVMNDAGFKDAMGRIGDAVSRINIPVTRAAPAVNNYASAVDRSASSATKASDAMDAAFAVLQRSVGVEKQRASAALDAARTLEQEFASLFSYLRTSVFDLRGQVAQTADWQAEQGWSFIDDALTAWRGDGALPQQEQLQSAVDAVRRSLDKGWSGDADFMKMVLANKLEELQQGSEAALSEQERLVLAGEAQVNALDALLANASDQLAYAKGTYTALLALPQALAGFNSAIGNKGLPGVALPSLDSLPTPLPLSVPADVGAAPQLYAVPMASDTKELAALLQKVLDAIGRLKDDTRDTAHYQRRVSELLEDVANGSAELYVRERAIA